MPPTDDSETEETHAEQGHEAAALNGAPANDAAAPEPAAAEASGSGTIAEAEARQKRVQRNIDRKAAGEKRTGFINNTFDQKWEEEILPYVREKLLIRPDEVRIDVYLTDPAPRGGGRQHVGFMYGSDVDGRGGNGAGAAFTEYMQDNFHMPLQKGEASYWCVARRVQGGVVIGDGEVRYFSPEDIQKTRTAQARARERRGGRGGQPLIESHALPPPGSAQAGAPQPPSWGEPARPAQPQAPGYDPEKEHLRHELNDLRVKLGTVLGKLEARGEVPVGTAAAAAAPPPPPAPAAPQPEPLTARSVAEIVNEVLDAREKRAAAAAATNPPQVTESSMSRARGFVGELREFLHVQKEFKGMMTEAAKEVWGAVPGQPPPPPQNDDPNHVHQAEPVDDIPGDAPPADDGLPFVTHDIPNVRHPASGEPMRWVEFKERDGGRKLETLEKVMAWASANPAIAEDVAKKVMDVAERAVNAVTLEGVPGGQGRGSDEQ